LVWLVSYPKSGNTWLRTFLSNFEGNGDAPADINDPIVRRISSSRGTADEALGVECSDLTPDEIERYRPAVYRFLANQSGKELFVKTHDAYTLTAEGVPLFPSDVTLAAVYIVRNPLDVSVSFAHHTGKPIDDVIEQMGCESMAFGERADRLHLHLRQRLLSWSKHVLSWADQNAIRAHILRYEDMFLDAEKAFGGVVRFLGMENDRERIRRAVAFCSFQALRDQELTHGFNEKPLEAASFFRSGRVGEWRHVLTRKQAERLVRDHGAVMRRFGY
jgi:hypothetical protein